MLLNFIAFVLCTAVAAWQGVHGYLAFCIINAVAALINLLFAIKWFKNVLKIDS